MPDSLKARENRLRRMATRQRLTLSKGRVRDERGGAYGRYRLSDERPAVIGALKASHEATLDEIEAYLTDTTHLRWHRAQDGQYRWHVPAPAT